MTGVETEYVATLLTLTTFAGVTIGRWFFPKKVYLEKTPTTDLVIPLGPYRSSADRERIVHVGMTPEQAVEKAINDLCAQLANGKVNGYDFNIRMSSLQEAKMRVISLGKIK